MTCAESREMFSARADDALALDERAVLEAHLAACADCRREWQRFAATVGLVRAVEPARAPAGFADRVLAAARPLPWYRRALRGLLLPWPVKLPLEAAAVVMVAGLAVLIFQRSPELQRETVPPPAAPAAPAEQTAPGAPPAQPKTGPADSAVARDQAPSGDSPPPSRSTADAGPAPPVAQRAAEEYRESRPEADARAKSVAPPRPQAARESKREDSERSAPPLAAGAIAPTVELRLAVGDRAAAERDVAAIVERLDGALVPGPASRLEIMVARDAFAALTVELARLGTLRVVRQPGELPPTVRVSLQLTD